MTRRQDISDKPTGQDWPLDGGETGALIRTHDWAATALGLSEDWPERLRAVVDLVLASGFPMVALWGPDLIQIYNDGYAAIMGERHPRGLGQPTRLCWPEVWHINGPIYERVRGGETLTFENALYPITRNGVQEDAWFTLSYSPFRDQIGGVAGILVTVVETTQRLRAEAQLHESERRLRAVLEQGPLAVAVIGPVGQIAFRNAEFDRLWGRPAHDTTAETYSRVYEGYHLDGRPVASGEWPGAQALQQGKVIQGEVLEIVHLSGRWIACSFNAGPIRDDDGRISGAVVMFRDVTEERRMQAALQRQSEERFRAIVETATDYAIFTTDADGRIETWPRGAQAVFGWTAEEAVDQSVDMTFTPEDRASGQPKRERQEAREKGHAPNVRWHVRKNGSRVFIDGVTRPLTSTDGTVTGYVKVGQDVTERRIAEAALKESEERFRSFAEASSDVLWILDADTRRLEYLSPAFERIWGESRDGIMTDLSRWAATVLPEDLPKVQGALDKTLAGQRSAVEYRVLRPDGSLRHIHDTGFPISDEKGQIRRAAGVAQDITRRRQAELALQSSQQRLRTLMEGIPQLVWRARQGGKWTWASPQWSAFTGQVTGDSHRLGWLEVVHPEDRVQVLHAWDGASAQGTFEVEVRLRQAATGDYRWFQARATPVRDDAGRIVEWLGTLTDVQDIKSLEERQGVLVSELQHRTRNLLAVVHGVMDQTRRESQNFQDFVAAFHDRLRALGRVQGLLSRLSEGSRVTFDELIRTELAAMGAVDAQGGGERVTLEGPSGVRLPSSTVQTFALALHELATNAMKYGALAQPSGHLAVRWHLVRDQAGPRLHVTWVETGVAMPDPSSAPQGSGYGRELIERALPYQLGAETSYELAADGVRCTIVLPVSSTMERDDA